MNNLLNRWARLLAFAPFAGQVVFAAGTGQVVEGNARFTVITPNLVRIEYAPDGVFVDAPSDFAANRTARYSNAQTERTGEAVTIRTSAFELRYRPTGHPLHRGNLEADIFGPDGKPFAHWEPYMDNPDNLGGARLSLDQWKQAGKVEDGILSRSGWFLLDDSRSLIWPEGRFRGRPDRKATDWYLFAYGTDYPAAFRSLREIGGATPMPRAYQLGSCYSRHWNYTQKEFSEIVDEYALNGFPLDVLVMDMGWHRPGWTGYTWNRDLLPNPRQLIDECHSRGIAVALNDHPGEIRPQEKNYKCFMESMGANSLSGDVLPFGWRDQTYLENYVRCMTSPLLDNGVDFWWLDGGSSLLNRLYFERSGRDGLRGATLARWFGWGSHRYPIQFSGDASTSFRLLRFEIPFTVSSGNAGCFFWSHDIGGFVGERNEESYARWCQFGAAGTALRVHSTMREDMDRRPWLYSPAMKQSMRRSFLLRSQLFPYIVSSVRQVHERNIPLLRAPYLNSPLDEAAYRQPQEYLFGDHLLVAPVVSPGAGSNRLARQAVWFPEGDWFNWFTGERFGGGREVLVAADIDEFPLYVRGGAPIPMRTEPDSNHIASPLADLLIRCFPGADGQRTETVLYEDDGVSRAYESGAYAKTRLSYSRRGDRVRIAVLPQGGHFSGQRKTRAYVVELPCTRPLSDVRVNGIKTGAEYDAENRVSRIRIPARPLKETMVVECNAPDADVAFLARKAFARRAMLPTADLDRPLAELLQDALGGATTDARKSALLAAAGIGALAKNERTTGYPDCVQTLKCYRNLGADVSVSYGAAATDPLAAALRFPSRVTVDLTGRRFELTGDSVQLPWNQVPGNLAPRATLSASSGDPDGATDGIVISQPEDASGAWRVTDHPVGAWIKLAWDSPVEVGRLVLFGSPNFREHVTSATVQFSDGTSCAFGDLLPYIDRENPWDNSGMKQGVALELSPRRVEWLKITVTGISKRSVAAGLSEVAVFR